MRKPIFIPTGEEIDLQTVIDVPTNTTTFIEVGDENKIPIPADLIAFPPNMEERRYELAKMFMQNYLTSETDTRYIRCYCNDWAQLSVQCADALLKALSETKTEESSKESQPH